MAKVSTKVCNKYTPANSSTKILTSKGWINIEHIKQGNFVLTHTGKFRRVLKIDSYLSESQKTIIGGNLAYDNKSGQLKIASNNVSLLTFAGWQNIVDIQIGQTVQLLAGTCKTCKKQIAFYRNYCSKSCASFATASGQWQREEHRESVSNKRRELMEKHNNRLPYLEKYLQSGKHKENLKRTPENIAKQKIGMAKFVATGMHPFQDPIVRSKGAITLGQNKYSSFIERKVKWLLDCKGIGYTHNMPFEREAKTKAGKPKMYFIDFVLNDYKIAIEVDGEYWHKDKEADKARQAEIEEKGYMVLRFPGEQVRKRLHECSEEIDRVLKNHKGEYSFMFFEVESVETKPELSRSHRVYDLTVDVDNSYIANGFIVQKTLQSLENKAA